MTDCAFPGDGRACFCDGPCRFLAIPERTEPHEPDDPGMSAADILEKVADRLSARKGPSGHVEDTLRVIAQELRLLASELRG